MPHFASPEKIWLELKTTDASLRLLNRTGRSDPRSWLAVKAAFTAMEDEIEALVSDRARNPLPAPSPGLPS